MRPGRHTLAGCLVAALLVTSLAVPTAAVTRGKMAIVQGNYGVRVDVCINGREVKSAMPFGAKVYRILSRGTKVIKVARAAPGACKGEKLVKREIKFPGGSDLTVVITKRKPKKMLIFDNTPPAGPFLAGAHRFFRHAADIGKVTFRHEARPLPTEPALAGEPTLYWKKGRSAYSYVTYGIGGTPMYSTTWVSRYPMLYPPEVVAGPVSSLLGSRDRYEWILIGTGKHPRLVLLRRNY